MALSPGTRLGAYEILSLIGQGGMGEVYRARDPRLGRDVAIKVLPTACSADPDRLRRFEQEARAAAALNHPALLAVFDIGTEGGAPYIVSELLEGETLRDRLRRDVLPLRKAVDYAIQIARGLSAAHDKGIVHRDLKPENLFVTTDGRVKILDFGLAKLTESAAALAGASVLTSPVGTGAGVMLGTMGYMAPEQLRGGIVDHRADIFAFGAALYEMLSGQRAFSGATAADTISAILDKDPPDLPLTERHIPPAVARVVDRCLEKNAAARFQSTHDLAFALEGVSGQSDASAIAAVPSAPKRNRREQIAWGVAVASIAIATAALVVTSRSKARDDPAAIRFAIHSPDGAVLTFGPNSADVISPDGRRLAFAAVPRGGGPQMLWIRALDSLEARVLNGTEHVGSSGAFWSPDSRFVAFFADGKLKKIDVGGGAPQTLCDAPGPNGGATWGREDVILFALVGTRGLLRVSAAGGQATSATTLEGSRQETSHTRPSFLPDGRHFTYLVQPGNVVYVGSLDSTTPTRLLTADSAAVYSNGHLLFVRQGTLFAQPFDPFRLTLPGEAVQVAESISSNSGIGFATFTASSTGVLTYATGTNAAASNQVTWFDRSGKSLGTVGSIADYRGIELSPDERRLAEHPHELPGGDLWVRDLVRDTTMRLTFAGHNTGPVWSPDGTQIAFGANAPPPGQRLLTAGDVYGGTFNLFLKRSDGAGDASVLVDSEASKLPTAWKQPTSWSPDGQQVVFDMIDPKTSYDIWAVPVSGDRKPRPLVRTEFQEAQGQISPDGRWLAFTSNRSKRMEVFVIPLSGSAGTWQISTDGGAYPRWRHDGKELFYISTDRKLMAVPIAAVGPAIEPGTPKALFGVRFGATFTVGTAWSPVANTPYPYVVTRDGQRFLVTVDTSQQATETPLTVVVNWPAGLRK